MRKTADSLWQWRAKLAVLFYAFTIFQSGNMAGGVGSPGRHPLCGVSGGHHRPHEGSRIEVHLQGGHRQQIAGESLPDDFLFSCNIVLRNECSREPRCGSSESQPELPLFASHLLCVIPLPRGSMDAEICHVDAHGRLQQLPSQV